MYKIAVFVSGRGSNLQAILDEINRDNLKVEICAVVSDKSSCGALDIARRYGIDVFSVSLEKKEGYSAFEDLSRILIEKKTDLVVLAGFLKKIPDQFIDDFNDRIINIHPALLPSFGGKGMYGMHVHTAVFNASAKVSGATVHFVDKIYDNGKIIDQRCIDISDVLSPEEIAKRVLMIEHKLLPHVIMKFSLNKVKKIGQRVVLE